MRLYYSIMSHMTIIFELIIEIWWLQYCITTEIKRLKENVGELTNGVLIENLFYF